MNEKPDDASGWVLERDGYVLLELLVTPKATRFSIAGPMAGRLRVTVPAPPTDGKANEELIRQISKFFKVPKRDVSIVRGHQGRRKTLRIEGANRDVVLRSLDCGGNGD